MLEMRDYANEGGKLVVDGRNVAPGVHVQRARTLTATGPYTWTPDKLFGFFYPPNNAGDDDLPGHGLAALAHDLERHVAELPRRRRPPGRQRRHRHDSSTRLPIAPKAGRIFEGMAPFTVDTARGQRPERRPPTARRSRWREVPAAPAHAGRASRAERAAARGDASRPTTPPTPTQTTDGGAVISTRDTVTFGFGLEQVDQTDAQRARQARHDAPAADHRGHAPRRRSSGSSTRPTNYGATPTDPVDLELTAFDERGDMKEVRLLRQRRRWPRPTVYPFQFRYTPRRRPSAQTVHADGQGGRRGGQRRDVGPLNVNVVAAPRGTSSQSPEPVANPTLTGTPDRRLDAHLRQRRLPQQTRRALAYEWLRNGAVIAGATTATYVLTDGRHRP